MIWSGLFLLRVRADPRLDVQVRRRTTTAAEAGVRDLYRLVIEIFRKPGYVVFYVVGMTVVGFHLWHGVSSAFQTLGADTPRFTPVHAQGRMDAGGRPRGRLHLHPAVGVLRRGPVMTLDSKVPGGPAGRQVGPPQVRGQARQPREQAQVHDHRGRNGPGRRVGGGIARASSATTSTAFCIHDSPRRAHSIAAQGGINAAKNYKNDGDSIYRLFYDTIKGGDYRAREANVYRLAAAVGATSSTSASRRACRSRASTAACSTTDRSAARRCRAPSTRAGRRASSCCSARTRR